MSLSSVIRPLVLFPGATVAPVERQRRENISHIEQPVFRQILRTKPSESRVSFHLWMCLIVFFPADILCITNMALKAKVKPYRKLPSLQRIGSSSLSRNGDFGRHWLWWREMFLPPLFATASTAKTFQMIKSDCVSKHRPGRRSQSVSVESLKILET